MPQKPENPDFKTELLALVPFLRAFARSLAGNQEAADDLAQETLVKAWQSRASFIAGHQSEGLALHHPAQPVLFRPPPRLAAGALGPGSRRAHSRWRRGQIHSARLSDTVRALKHLSAEQREALILVGAGRLFL